jgi:hypothetical protein
MKEEKRMFTYSEMIDRYDRLTDKEKINVLWGALTLIRHYNCRTKFECVFLSMGYQLRERDGSYFWIEFKNEYT